MRGKPEVLDAWFEAVKSGPDTSIRVGVGLALGLLCDLRDTLVALGSVLNEMNTRRGQ